MRRGVIFLLGVVVLIVVILIVILIGRNQPTAPSAITLSIWSPFDEKKTYEKITQSFEAGNSNVSVNFTYIEAKDAKEYEAKAVNAIADGNGPDIWLSRFDWIPKHATKSLPAIPASRNIDPVIFAKGVIEPALVDLNTYGGKLYGVPLAADTLAIIYNTTLYHQAFEAASAENKTKLEKLPASWDELKTESSIVSQKRADAITRSAFALGTADNTFAPADVLAAFLVQSGTTILSEDGKDVAFNLAQFKNDQPAFPATEALTFFTSFARPTEANYSWSSTLGDPVTAFLQEKTGALIGYYSTLQSILKQDPKFTIKVGPLVQKNPDVARVDFAAGWTHLVNKTSPHGALAWDLLGSFMDVRVQGTYAEATHRLSVAKQDPTRLTHQLYDGESAAELFLLQLQTAKGFVKPEWQLVDEVLQDAIRQVIVNNQTPQNSIDSAAQRLKAFVTLPGSE